MTHPSQTGDTSMHEMVTHLFSESDLLQGVKVDSPRLFDYVQESCHRILPKLCEIPDAFGEYTDHGVRHSVNVFRLGEQLLGRGKLSSWEVGIFILSCFYHDIGMVCPQSEWENLERSAEFRREARLIRRFVLPNAQLRSERPETIRRQTITEYLRRHHGSRGEHWILENRPENSKESFVEGIYFWDQVARVSIGHTLDASEIISDKSYARTSPIGAAEEVDVLLLTCLLRLADICHLSRDRAYPFLRNNMKFSSAFSEKIWKALGHVAGVSCDLNRSIIVVRGEPRDFELHRMVHEEVLNIRRELRNCHRLLAGGQSLPWKFVDGAQIRPAPQADYKFVEQGKFRLEEGKIIGLLMGSRLYAEPLYSLRECVQNSLDALSIVRLRDRSSEGAIVLRYSGNCETGPVLDIVDSGTGMDQSAVLDHLLSAGARPFLRSERRLAEWGELRTGDTFIARHGIGFLSCFMVAREVEVFSSYPGADPIRVLIDSPVRSVKFFDVSGTADFPSWTAEGPPVPTPWQVGRGTCVRLHLLEELAMDSLMAFIANDLPRIRAKLFVVYDSEWVEVRENWRPDSYWSHREGEKNLQELESALFGFESGEGSMYDGPPGDRALKVELHGSGDIRGLVTLSMGTRGRNNRLTQDGILVRDGAATIWELGRNSDVRRPPFYFNIDISGDLQLELDVERARVLKSDFNRERCRLIADWIEEHGLISLNALEGSLYFPCGGEYYHGGIDLLRGHGDSSLYFHRPLREWYGLVNLNKALERYGRQSFLQAKLYFRLGAVHCQYKSLGEMEDEEQYLLVSRKPVFDYGGVKGDSAGEFNSQVERCFKEIQRLWPLDDLLYVSDSREFFGLPLLCAYQVASIIDLPFSRYSLIRLCRKSSWALPTQEVVGSFDRLLSGSS